MLHRRILLPATLLLLPGLSAANAALNLEPLGILNTGGAEISAYDASTRRLFVTNAGGNSVAIVDASNPAALRRIGTIDVAQFGSPTSVAAHQGLIAVAVANPQKTQPGVVALYRASGALLGTVTVGALPDTNHGIEDGR